MAHPGFGHLWQPPVLSDVDVVLCVETAAASSQDSASSSASNNLGAAHTVLQQFPAHWSILTLSPVFEAQVGAALAQRVATAANSRPMQPQHTTCSYDLMHVCLCRCCGGNQRSQQQQPTAEQQQLQAPDPAGPAR